MAATINVVPGPGTPIQAGINAATNGDTVSVAAGTYNENVLVDKDITLQGAGPGASVISGPIGSGGSTVSMAASGATLSGFTITRAGNNTTDWNLNLNTNGVSAAQFSTSITIVGNLITGNRTAIDINRSGNHTITGNTIDNNRSGILLRNQTDNMTVTENEITNNWTVGVLFLVGSSELPQTSTNSNFTGNNISGNWYGQVVDRQTGGPPLPAPGASPKNFIANYLGSTNPVVTTANSAEPGYAAQIPVAFGGSATAPGGQPDIAGAASANIDYTPWCTDSSCSTLSTNANLTALSLSSGTLSPAFSPSTIAYSASVDNSVSSVTVNKTASPGANAVVSGGSSLTVGSNAVTVDVTSADGSVTKAYTVTVNRSAAATASISASPASLTTGNSSTLSWSSSNVSSCAASGSWSGSQSGSGSASTGVLNAAGSYTYTISCTGPGGSANASTTVTATSPLTPPVDQPQSVIVTPDEPGTVAVLDTGETSASPVEVTLTWDPGTFTEPVTVTAAPNPSDKPVRVNGGFTIGLTTINLTVTDMAGNRITKFAKPMKLHISASEVGDVPAFSKDGTTWTPIPRLFFLPLPPTQEDGYFVNTDGSVDIYTRHATLFGLLKDTQKPSTPTIKARIAGSELYLRCKAKDNLKVAKYLLLFNGRVIRKVAAKNYSYMELAARVGTFRMVAVDTAGNKSKASRAIKVTRYKGRFIIGSRVPVTG